MLENNAEYAVAPPPEWAPKFLCRSFKSPIILSDGAVTSCTLDHHGRNRLGSIYEDDFTSLIDTFGSERLLAMSDPSRKPVCYSCFTRLPAWRDRGVPRAGWINDAISARQRDDYLAFFDPGKLVFNVELSSACNLRCTGCALANPQFRLSRGVTNIDMDQLMAWLNGHVHRIAQVRLYHLGETWLHPRWFELCRFLKDANPGLSLYTSTNGMLLDTEDKLRRVVDAGIDHVMFSIHGAFQASAEMYMGKAFRIDKAFAAARGLIRLRDAQRVKPYVSWKYLLFAWNDSDAEVAAARQLLDDYGFDEIHFTITSQPAPSKRYAIGSEGWERLRAECASLWPRAADYQSYTPMEAVYPGLRHRLEPAFALPADPFMPEPADELDGQAQAEASGEVLEVGANNPARPAAGSAVHQVAPALPADSANLVAEGRKLLEAGQESAALRLVQEGAERTAPSAPLHKLLGDALLAAGQAGAAVDAYRAALNTDPRPHSEFTHLGLARSLRALSRFAEAGAAYEIALRIRAAAGGRAYGEDVYLEWREVCLALGERTTAAAAYRRWVEDSYLVENRSQVIYCPIAKNASTFLKTALLLNSAEAETFRASGKDAHVYSRQPQGGFRLGDADRLGDPEHFSFVVLRDPLERIVSAYAYNFVRPLQWRPHPDLPGRAVVREVYRRDGLEPDYEASVSFDAFVRYLARTADADLDHHWRAQTAFFSDIAMFNLVGCVERLPEVTAEISRRRGWVFPVADRAAINAGKRERLKPDYYHRMPPRQLATLSALPATELLLTDELRELLAQRYAADLELYRCRFGDLRSMQEPIYPTGGALVLHRQLPVDDLGDGPPPPAIASASPPLERAPPLTRPDGEVVYFAAPWASTDAPGTADAPLPLAQAIQAALAAQAGGSPARVVLRGGVYRGQVFATGSPGATVPLVIEADADASVVLSGADVWTDWQQCGAFWQHAWPYRWGLSSVPPDYGISYLRVPDLMRRRELVVVDGVVQRQVLDAASLVPGTYYVDEDAASLLLALPIGLSPASATVEVALRSKLLHLTGVRRLTMRGLRFQYDASAYFVPQAGALQLTNCADVVIEDCQACDNNNKGIQLDGGYSAGIVLRRVAMNRNGCLGLLASRISGLRLEDCETSFNNWRGDWCGFYRGSPCGLKLLRSQDVRVVRHKALRNLATGIWIDEDNHDVDIEACEVFGNLRGIHVEATTGPVSITDSCVVGNRQEPVPSEWRWAFGSGIAITHAQNVTVRRCFLAGNDLAQIGVRTDRPIRRLKDTREGALSELFTADLHVFDNTLVADARGGWLRVPDAAFDGGRCFASLRSDHNRLIGSLAGRDFLLASYAGRHNTHERLSLAEWQALTANDGGSMLDGRA